MAGRDKVFGALISIGAVIVGMLYFWALVGGFALWAMEIAVSTGVVIFLAMVLWIGITIATTPSIEEIEAAARKKR